VNGEVMAVPSMVRDDEVRLREGRAKGHPNELLTDARVHRAVQSAFTEQLEQTCLELPDQDGTTQQLAVLRGPLVPRCLDRDCSHSPPVPSGGGQARPTVPAPSNPSLMRPLGAPTVPHDDARLRLPPRTAP
jgi:hypothetical protein